MYSKSALNCMKIIELTGHQATPASFFWFYLANRSIFKHFKHSRKSEIGPSLRGVGGVLLDGSYTELSL